MQEQESARAAVSPLRPGRERTRYARPKVAVDTVVFAVQNCQLKTYLVQLKRGPLRGRWAFPGGLVRVGETLDEAANRELRAAIGPTAAYMEQLFSFGDPARDPRAHVVSVAYVALLPDPAIVGAPAAKYSAGGWFEVGARLPPLAYDHEQMARYALRRLTAKLEYSNIAVALLPRIFTFKQLEDLYAALLGRRLDRRNFRRRILAMRILRELSAKQRGAHRPAALYSFVSRTPHVVQML